MKSEERIDDKDLAKYVELYRIVTHIEYLIEEFLEEEPLERFCIHDLLRENMVKVLIPRYSNRLCNYRENFLGKTIDFICSETIDCQNTDVSSTLQTLFKGFYNITKAHLEKHVFEDVEYMEIVLADGSSVIVQGFEEAVFIPHIKDIVFIAHTHPMGYPPIPSKKDLISLRDIIAERGLGGCIHSALGSFCMYRVGIPTWRDYELLTLSINRGNEIKDICSLSPNIRCFTSSPILGNT